MIPSYQRSVSFLLAVTDRAGLLYCLCYAAVDITPAAVSEALSNGAYSRALLMALRLNEDEHIDRVLAAIPTQHIPHVVEAIPTNRLERSDTAHS